jgi:hypothetical protein
MLSAWTIVEEIPGSDEASRLFCSIAARGEAQGGGENGRIAALVPGSPQDPAATIARPGADEDEHGRIFTALLRNRSLTAGGRARGQELHDAAGRRRHRAGARPAARRPGTGCPELLIRWQ